MNEVSDELGKPSLIRPSSFDVRSKVVRIADKEVRVGGPLPKVREGEKLVRYTQSICPYCYALLPAVIVERDGKLYIRKVCPEHGEIEEIYQGSSEFAKRIEKWFVEGRGPRHVYTELTAPCPYSCGLCPLHKNHTALANLVLTNRCDLSCWYCFFYAEKSGFVYEPSIEQIEFMVKQLLKQGVTPAIQLTGGEPTLREDLVDIVKLLRGLGVRHIQLNTHAIAFARLYLTKGEEEAVKLAKSIREAGVNTIYMSFDGVSPKANPKNHWEIPFIFETFRKGGVTSVVLVPTVIKGVNTHELGDIIKFAALNMDIVRSVNFQPVSLTGMIKKAEREKLRVTIYDTIKMIEEQTSGQITVNDWFPVPTSTSVSEFIESLSGKFKFEMANHPECGVGTYVYVKKVDSSVEFIPITKMIDVEGFLDYLSEKAKELRSGGAKFVIGSKILLSMITKYIKWSEVPSDVKKILPKLLFEIFTKQSYESLGEWHYKFMFLGMMHFMDLYNYDVERVMRCNVHYLMPDGRVVPFCTFNVLSDVYRDYVQKKYMLTLDEWVKLKGEGSVGDAMKYRRDLELIKKMTSHPLYMKTYEPFISKWIDMYPWLKEA
ncbi:MAG: radical SAM protein [Zestosphaera tikiterensis]|uniref:Radical SAM protein n=1 Tax=Zestosphaera tikiterensis TaxID=1973259 RepID=A0A2R7Y869_9CREN|nr:MAG: radical SAM protein [Zestosphaera tikiterensis]